MPSLFESSKELQLKSKAFERIFNACNILLKESDEAKDVRTELNKRVPVDVKNWSFGYFPKNDELDLLLKYVSIEDLLLTNLVYIKEFGRIDYGQSDHFGILNNHQLIMPYRNLYGDILGIVGRTTLSKEDQIKLKISKYKNSSLPKSLNLFGFYESKESILENDSVIIVEGQFDCITSHRFGYTNTVALGSASFTNYHFFLVKRYTNNIILLLDNDDAGNREVKNIFERFGDKANIQVKNLPTGYKDIDEFLIKNNSFKLVS
jgi:DNA primase